MDEARTETLSREEQAFLIKILWEALQAPPWSRDDLIEFGKAIFGKTPLKDLDPKRFNQLFPFLKVITDHLGIKLKETVLPAPASPSPKPDEISPAESPKAPSPAPTEPNTPPQT